MVEPTRFLIHSAGRTATHWVSAALSAHPDIACTHGPELQVFVSDEESEAARIERHHREGGKLKQMGPDAYLDHLITQTDKRFVGNIHGMMVPDYMNSPRDLHHPTRFCAILRHPVQRIQSFANHYLKVAELIESTREEFSDWFRDVRHMVSAHVSSCADRPDFDEDLAALCWCRAAALTFGNDYLQIKSGLRSFGFERLTMERDYFLSLCSYVTDGQAEITEEYEVALDQLTPISVTQAGQDAWQVAENWAEWQHRLLSIWLPRRQADSLYGALGYDLSMVAR